MSYDIELKCDKCHAEPVSLPDPTYNLTPIFDLALVGRDPTEDRPKGLCVLDGRQAGDTIAQLEGAAKRLWSTTYEDELRKLEPANRWGTLECARKVVDELLEAARRFPEHRWRVR